ncbi:1,4-dihydroxy-2-naphthoate prenyltransferase [Budvicia diplopodorum]|uniref:1,4-dihydroxy-2-naphthoate prenyltransferase n=1 Tax=Budvicia diplopodorum TaxID=1119056 RepID=UPI00135A6D9E|nr:1,4-dihydroxy-2-naphthoate prenyltransferase [Budvicia diplopodorum]
MLRRISWVFGVLSVLVPAVLFLWQWIQHQKLLAAGLVTDELGWTLSVLFVDVFVAGVLGFVAVVLNAVALYRLPAESTFNPVLRVLEMLLLSLPLFVCLFFLGTFIIHG